jgi:Ran GTPase-activating protein (RanGAP) involved in mRNA processing and transport
MRALIKLDISSNAIEAAGGKLIAAALKGNQVVTELNISHNYLAEDSNEKPDMSGVIALADVIPGMRALIRLDISNNAIRAEQKGSLERICAASGIDLAM